jgi:hypothetical protein
VFKRISRLSTAKNYFSADMWNIEEILSILEMDEQLGSDKQSKSEFIRLLSDTVKAYTPPLKPSSRSNSNWSTGAFGEGADVKGYGAFVAELLGVELSRTNETSSGAFVARAVDGRTTTYSVVTLNYDLVLEDCESFIKAQYEQFGTFGFSDTTAPGMCALFKLHGSVHDDSIIPPTWNKSLRPQIEKAWRGAYDAIRRSNHIRIVGYSLPVSDAYVRYLLKAAIAEAPHLKSIHVLTHDPTGSAKRTYDDFITFNYYKFWNYRTELYLNRLAQLSRLDSGNGHMARQLEPTHAGFFEG